MKIFGFFDQRIRGFRIIDVGGIGVLLVLVLAVYLSKAGAGGERADIDHVSQLIYDEQTRIRLLQAEVANLEQPERLGALSSQYLNLQPVAAKHEVQAEALPDLALIQKANAAAPANPAVAPAAAGASVDPPQARDAR
jgi:hypothetical protein